MVIKNFNSRNKEKLANKFNKIVTNFENGQKENINNKLIEIINEKDKTYSPLAFFFLLDNDLIHQMMKLIHILIFL